MERESFEDAATAADDERALRQRQGRPRGAARRRRRLHGRRRRAHRPGRLAAHRVPHAGRRAVLRRHVLPARAAPRAAVVPAGAARRRRRLPRAPGGRRRAGRGARRGLAPVGARPSRRASRSPRRCSPRPSAACSRSSTRATAASGTRRSSRPRSVLEFLLRRGALEPVRLTLDGMAAGGMYDLVGGGFHRYSVDAQWLVPHFEKMLYDNALLVPAYLHAWLLSGEERYREVAERTLEYMLRELRLPGGGFASAQDADTDGVEGLTYTWTPEDEAPARAAAAVRARTLDPARRARRGDARAPAGDSRAAAAAGARRQGDRVVERASARGPRRGRAPARAAGLPRCGGRAR